jgi:hypothetical protein
MFFWLVVKSKYNYYEIVYLSSVIDKTEYNYYIGDESDETTRLIFFIFQMLHESIEFQDLA